MENLQLAILRFASFKVYTDGICLYMFMYIQRPGRRSTRKVVYPSSFNYLINSVSSIIFARVIKPQAKVNNSHCTFSSRSRWSWENGEIHVF